MFCVRICVFLSPWFCLILFLSLSSLVVTPSTTVTTSVDSTIKSVNATSTPYKKDESDRSRSTTHKVVGGVCGGVVACGCCGVVCHIYKKQKPKPVTAATEEKHAECLDEMKTNAEIA